jgi:OOP family OmpA-OmpF porin
VADPTRPSGSRPNAAESAPPAADSDAERDPSLELERLRELLLGDERRAIDELQRRYDDWELTPEELADQLPEAIGLRASRDESLARALAPTLEAGIASSVERNPRQIAQAIYPVLGPAIRRAISEALSGFVETLNRAIEHSLSWRGLKWRLEALRAGVPFGEIVLKHALVYRIEEAFLIQPESGLPIGHVALDEARTEDPDLVSGMLTAIQDFVADSFRTSREAGLSRFKVGELTVRVESGPRATLAAVVRGQEPGDLVEKMQAVLETVHLQFRRQLAEFDGDPTPLEPAEPLLAELLETVVATDRAQSRSLAPRIAWGLAAALLVLLIVLGVRSQLAWKRAVRALRAEPGLTLLEAERSLGRWRFEGLKDPLARDPAEILSAADLDPSDVTGHWESYLSFDPEMVLARARERLRPPAGVELAVAGETLRLSGEASARWAATVADRVASLAGISEVDLSGFEVRLPDDLAGEAAEIAARRVLFEVGSARLQADALALLDELASRIRRLSGSAGEARYRVRVRLIGRTDSSGTEEGNRTLSEQRARAVQSALVERGVDPAAVSVAGVGVADPLQAGDEGARRRLNRSVSFEVAFEAADRAGGGEE